MSDWRLILGAGDGDEGDRAADAAPGPRNMAIDHALFESVQAGGRPVLRLYRWDPPCLSLGRNQRAVDLYDPGRLAAAGIGIVRRPTGGLAVLHDRELTYCVLAPLALLGGAREAYQLINHALVDGLRRLGVHAALAGGGTARSPSTDAAAPCFQAPADGEVMAAGRKLVGSAQRCEHDTLLQHGSLLLDGSQSVVQQMLVPAGAASLPGGAPAGAITLSELLGAAPDWAALVQAVRAGFESVCGTRFASDALTRAEAGRAVELSGFYSAGAWTWRR